VWDIPDKYRTLDMESYILSLCKDEKETLRVELEYAMFEERNLIPLLQFLMYIVDYMREHKIVWGVGRGSSVASYCLYLLGVHKVDSIKYDLPIEEFLK
jgi:DNA polymerase III alpha subunit